MKFRIQKGLFSHKILDEKGVTVAKICRKIFTGTTGKILDVKGNTVYTTDIVYHPIKNKKWNCEDSKKYVIYKDNKEIATANLKFALTPERTKIQSILFRRPQVDKMDVDTIFGRMHIERQKNNCVIIYQDDAQLAKISSLISIKPIYLELTGKYDVLFWAAIYMLVEYMMYEDDLIAI